MLNVNLNIIKSCVCVFFFTFGVYYWDPSPQFNRVNVLMIWFSTGLSTRLVNSEHIAVEREIEQNLNLKNATMDQAAMWQSQQPMVTHHFGQAPPQVKIYNGNCITWELIVTFVDSHCISWYVTNFDPTATNIVLFDFKYDRIRWTYNATIVWMDFWVLFSASSSTTATSAKWNIWCANGPGWCNE